MRYDLAGEFYDDIFFHFRSSGSGASDKWESAEERTKLTTNTIRAYKTKTNLILTASFFLLFCLPFHSYPRTTHFTLFLDKVLT